MDSEGSIMGRIKRCQEQLQKWNWREFGNINKILKQKKGETSTVRVVGQLTWEGKGDQESER